MIYELVDSGQFEKLEKWGPYLVRRPSASAVWEPNKDKTFWQGADLEFKRDGQGDGNWLRKNKTLPDHWQVEVSGLKYRIQPTSFGHLGLFPEQATNWEWLQNNVRPGDRVLNLFAYTGGSTLACAKAGASVVHVDASKGTVNWARENAGLNGLEGASIRWIVDDVQEFVEKELRRGQSYTGFILDPPSYGRGHKKQLWKIEKHLMPLLHQLKKLAGENFRFCLLSSHSPAYTPIAHGHQLQQVFGEGLRLEVGEMLLNGPGALALPAGVCARIG